MDNLVVCIPVKLHPKHPDQSPCTQEKCPVCHQLMWMSEKKKALMTTLSNVKVCCMECIPPSYLVNGIKVIDLQDSRSAN